MRLLLIALILSSSAACEMPTDTDTVYVEAESAEEQPAAHEPEAWQPEAGMLYILDVQDAEYHSEQPEDYSTRYAMLAEAVRQLNRRQVDGYPFRLVGGGEL